jgi:hypothetical protein
MRSDRARNARALALLALFAPTSACSLLFSLDGYEGTALAPRDGEGGRGDATPLSDAEALGDGGFCTPDAIFCDDFERDDVLGAWTSSTQSGGTLAIATGTPTGRALTARVTAAEAEATVALTKQTTATVSSSAVMRMRIRIASTPTLGGVHATHLTFTTASRSTTVFPYVFSSGLSVAELVCVGASCQYNQIAPVAFAPGVWHDVTLNVDFTASPARYQLDLDGTPAIDARSTFGAGPGVVTITGGAAHVDVDHDAIELEIDDLSVAGR